MSRTPLPSPLVDAAVVSARLENAGARPAGSAPLALERGWPAAGGLSLLYRDPGDGSWWSLCSGAAAAKGNGGVPLADLGTVARRFPSDPALPGLTAALDPEAVAGRLILFLPPGSHGSLQVEPVSYKPGKRAVIRYSTAGGARLLFGKCYRRRRDGVTWSSHRALAVVRSRPRTADPVGRIVRWNMLLWNASPGTSLRSLLSGPEARRAVAAVGRALASLQGAGVAWSRLHRRADELAVLESWAAAAGEAVPSRAAELEPALDGVRRAADRAGAAPLRPAHRDLHDGQVLLQEGEPVLLDLDTAGRAEPELDVGNFLAHLTLRRLQGEPVDVETLRGEFLAAYGSRAGEPDASRLRFYQSGALARLACVYLFRPGGDRLWPGLIEAARERAGAAGGVVVR